MANFVLNKCCMIVLIPGLQFLVLTQKFGIIWGGNYCCIASLLLRAKQNLGLKSLLKGSLPNEIGSSFKVWSLIVWFILLEIVKFCLISNYRKCEKYVKNWRLDQRGVVTARSACVRIVITNNKTSNSSNMPRAPPAQWELPDRKTIIQTSSFSGDTTWTTLGTLRAVFCVLAMIKTVNFLSTLSRLPRPCRSQQEIFSTEWKLLRKLVIFCWEDWYDEQQMVWFVCCRLLKEII